MANSFSTNFTLAREAVKHVKIKLTKGADNKLSDMYPSLGLVKVCVSRSRAAAEKSFNEHFNVAQGQLERELAKNDEAFHGELRAMNTRNLIGADIRIKAEKASSWKCGNCQEQAAVAFIYLLDHRVHPLDYYMFSDQSHAFVVIGRREDSDSTKPESWGSEAVICDPWCYLERNQVYAAKELKRVWGSKSPHLHYSAPPLV